MGPLFVSSSVAAALLLSFSRLRAQVVNMRVHESARSDVPAGL
jgi:hypothetical protein